MRGGGGDEGVFPAAPHCHHRRPSRRRLGSAPAFAVTRNSNGAPPLFPFRASRTNCAKDMRVRAWAPRSRACVCVLHVRPCACECCVRVCVCWWLRVQQYQVLRRRRRWQRQAITAVAVVRRAVDRATLPVVAQRFAATDGVRRAVLTSSSAPHYAILWLPPRRVLFDYKNNTQTRSPPLPPVRFIIIIIYCYLYFIKQDARWTGSGICMPIVRCTTSYNTHIIITTLTTFCAPNLIQNLKPVDLLNRFIFRFCIALQLDQGKRRTRVFRFWCPCTVRADCPANSCPWSVVNC